jgi:hypothetical protein
LLVYAAFKVSLLYTLTADQLSEEKEIKPDFKDLFSKYIKLLSDMQLFKTRRLFTFLFFVFISACFWLVRSLGEQYETDVTYPVRYMNFPENKVLTGTMPDKLQLRVKANGFSILKSKLNLNLIPIRFNVSSFSLNSIGIDTFYVVTETVKDIISSDLDGITILDITPDTLFFRFTDMAIKKVAVKPVLAIQDKFYQKQFMQNGDIRVIPDSIIISGPGNIIRTINSLVTEPLSFSNIADTIQTQCSLQPIDNVNFSQQKVEVIIPVDRFTEVEKNITVVPVNVPDSLTMIAIPGQVTIKYRICLSNYNKLKTSQIAPCIDYNILLEKKAQRLTVFLVDTPMMISNISFNPKETEFLITRK